MLVISDMKHEYGMNDIDSPGSQILIWRGCPLALIVHALEMGKIYKDLSFWNGGCIWKPLQYMLFELDNIFWARLSHPPPNMKLCISHWNIAIRDFYINSFWFVGRSRADVDGKIFVILNSDLKLQDRERTNISRVTMMGEAVQIIADSSLDNERRVFDDHVRHNDNVAG